ncbi:MAG TPA: signal peptidase II [Candidatus Saccharimonadales bacterium]|jgi:signal peptidase II|nr:signal peptidase II [Candidatus Saccharimonadales bacterium]
MRKYQVLISVLVVSLDALTKGMVRSRIGFDQSVTVFPGFFDLTHLQNTGAAFSMFADGGRLTSIALIVFSCVAIAVIVYLLWKNGSDLNSTTVALALIAGGALGNLWERALRGSVTDFLDLYIGQQHWPPFNLADSAICVGAALLLMAIVSGKHPQDHGET